MSCLPSGIMVYWWDSQFWRAMKQVLLAVILKLSHGMAISVASKVFGTIFVAYGQQAVDFNVTTRGTNFEVQTEKPNITHVWQQIIAMT